MEPIIGTLNMTLTIHVEPPTAAASYLGAAESLMEGVRGLAGGPPAATVALIFLACNAVECALKSFLANGRMTDEELKKPGIRHNLAGLWRLAFEKGLDIGEPPDWVKRLSEVHDWPYYLRYLTGVHGLVLPNAGITASELDRLVEKVRLAR
jgi:hypothetical protein